MITGDFVVKPVALAAGPDQSEGKVGEEVRSPVVERWFRSVFKK